MILLHLQSTLETDLTLVQAGQQIASVCPTPEQVQKTERLAIDYIDQAELQKKMEKSLTAIDANNPGMWAALQAQGIFRGSGTAGKMAFLFPGQGSQYVNMLKDLRDAEPVVVDTFREADEVMTPIFGKPLTSYIYVDGDEASIAQAEKNLKDTTITQPAMLTANVALLRVIQKYGLTPDVVIGHSLGEYAALVASGALKFADALKIVSARGREMAKVSMADNGCMAAISAPLARCGRYFEDRAWLCSSGEHQFTISECYWRRNGCSGCCHQGVFSSRIPGSQDTCISCFPYPDCGTGK